MNTKLQRQIRRIMIGLAIGITLVSSGCLGALQRITLNDQGRYAIDVRLSMSKAMITAMDSMGGETTDPDELFDLEDGPVNPEAIPGLTNVVVNQLDNDIDVGIQFSGVLGSVPDGIDPIDAPFIPFDVGNTVVIGLPPLEEGKDEPSDPQADQMAAMFFASTKYQLVLDKYLYDKVSSAKVMVGDTEHPASVSELPGSWLVEFPIVTWMQATEGCLLVVEL